MNLIKLERRSWSSSLSTSSNSKIGYSPTSDLIYSNSLNLTDKIAVRCCPCDPKRYKSIGPE